MYLPQRRRNVNTTLNIILESLGMTAEKAGGSIEFCRAICPCDECTVFDHSVIYIWDYERALPLCSADPELFFLCPETDSVQEALPGNLIPIPGAHDLLQLAQRVQDVFFDMNQWNLAMHLSIIKGKGVQDLLDLSEPVLGNTIQITDSATSLIACTRTIEPKDFISLSLREHGYHTDEAMAILGGAKTLAVWETLSDLGVVNFPHIWPFDVVYKVHRFQNTYYNHTVMMCDHVPLTPGLKDKFTMLVENLSICIEANWNRERAQKQTNIALFKALIDGECSAPDTPETLAENAGIPHSGHFLLLQIQSESFLQIPLARIIHELREVLPNALVSTYAGNIVALLHSSSQKTLLPEESVVRMTQHLDNRNICCGMSEPYTDLAGTAMAYRQANLALHFGSHPKLASLGPTAPGTAEGSRIISYTRYCAHYLLGNLGKANEAVWRSSFYGKLVKSLQQSDKNRQTGYLSILYTYLNCERNATEAGKLLHMHRNNVIYHVGKIQELLSVDLNDPHVRFNLLVSCSILALNDTDDFVK